MILKINGLQLQEVGDFEAQNCQYTTKADEWYKVQLTTSPDIEPSACCAFALYIAGSFAFIA